MVAALKPRGEIEADRSWLDDLALYRLTFLLRQVEGGALPPYSGSAWRGAFGRALHSQSCANTALSCNRPSINCQCVYRRWYAPTREACGMLSGQKAQPRPFVIVPSEDFFAPAPCARDYSLSMTIVGSAIGDLPAVIDAIRWAAARGIGTSDSRFALLSVSQHLSADLSDNLQLWSRGRWTAMPVLRRSPFLAEDESGTVTLRLLTPLRLRHRGKYVFDPRALTLRMIVTALLRRVSALTEHYCGRASSMRVASLIENADHIALDTRGVRFERFKRYSSTQERRVKMDGLVGDCRIGSDALGELWPLLQVGQWLHAGKGCTLGLGRIQVIQEHAR